VGLQRVDADYERVPDRRQAIEQAISEAREGDIVLLAGKGHETYQQVGSEKRPFDDRETAREVLRALGRGRGRG
jgi:UDP-N-acetylmuramoyl-L-alanyl-D-glutamate--2,6-diaminopimelate ligase